MIDVIAASVMSTVLVVWDQTAKAKKKSGLSCIFL